MPNELGNTSSSFYGITRNEGALLQSFTLVNKTNVAITANLAIKSSGVDYSIIPNNQTIDVYEMYVSDIPRQINTGENIVLLVTGSCDYYFSITNPK